MSDEAFEAMWPKIDTDGSGEVEPEEFIEYCSRKRK